MVSVVGAPVIITGTGSDFRPYRYSLPPVPVMSSADAGNQYRPPLMYQPKRPIKSPSPLRYAKRAAKIRRCCNDTTTHLEAEHMTENEIPDILCDVDVPQNSANVYIPNSWINDRAVDFSMKGLIFHVLSYPAGTVVSGAELGRGRAPDEPTPAEMVAGLEAAGYLVRNDDGRAPWRLVHPDRLPPLPV